MIVSRLNIDIGIWNCELKIVITIWSNDQNINLSNYWIWKKLIDLINQIFSIKMVSIKIIKYITNYKIIISIYQIIEYKKK